MIEAGIHGGQILDWADWWNWWSRTLEKEDESIARAAESSIKVLDEKVYLSATMKADKIAERKDMAFNVLSFIKGITYLNLVWEPRYSR